MRTIKVNEVQDVLKKERSNIAFINVLPPSAFEEEHIPHSINIPIDSQDFLQQVESHVKNQNTPIIVYCAGSHCPASGNAAVLLEEEGFTNVMCFKGGMEAWKNAGKAVQSGV